eukprot:365641-Chlamydomonas_euryale.AAC.3
MHPGGARHTLGRLGGGLMERSHNWAEQTQPPVLWRSNLTCFEHASMRCVVAEPAWAWGADIARLLIP